ncbi:hypothetical protein IWQ54_001470 [Labrenzia sp. EL_195]|nr:hypothetical protein [Labrenzia sp. EL_195]
MAIFRTEIEISTETIYWNYTILQMRLPTCLLRIDTLR